jgi:hypothetical protein
MGGKKEKNRIIPGVVNPFIFIYRAAWCLERPLTGKPIPFDGLRPVLITFIELIPNCSNVEFTYIRNYAEYFFKELCFNLLYLLSI